MDFLKGVQNFLTMVNDNWTTIIVIISLVIALVKKIKKYINLTEDEKIAIAKAQVSEAILKLISDAELDYTEWKAAGGIKRSQVISDIFITYPILSKVTDQKELIEWIDGEIDKALEELRVILEKNAEESSDRGICFC